MSWETSLASVSFIRFAFFGEEVGDVGVVSITYTTLSNVKVAEFLEDC